MLATPADQTRTVDPADHAGAFSLLRGRMAGSLRPRPRPRRSEWCEQNLRLPPKVSAQPGRYDLTDRPYLREILDAVDDAQTTEIVILGATQVGKSELVRAICASQGEIDAAPMMFAGPDQVYAREQREHIYRIADETPALRRRVPPVRFRNDRSIDLGRCLIYLAWSGSTQRLSGRSCKVVLCSEADRWRIQRDRRSASTAADAPINSLDLARERTKAFFLGTVVYEGSPIGASPNLGPLYAGSDRRTWWGPCTKCGHFQELRFFPNADGPYRNRGGVRGWKTDEESARVATPEEARQNAYYECEKCRAKLGPQQFAAMRLAGRWVPHGQHATPAGNLAGTPTYDGRRRGYRLTSLVSPTIGLGDIAEAYVRAKDHTDKLRKFFNDWLALPFAPRGKTPKWRDLGIRLAGAHPRGLVPRSCYFLTAAADVQADRVYWTVRAWANLSTSYLIDFGVHTAPAELKATHGPDDDTGLSVDLSALDQLLLRRFPVDGQNPLGHDYLQIRVLGVDCGYRPSAVYDYVRTHPGDRVLAVAGDPKMVPGALYRLSKIDRNARTGKAYGPGVRRYGIDTAAYKSDLQDRWFADKNQPGFWWLFKDVLEVRGGEDYLRQITNEARVTETLNGRQVTRWKLLDETEGNHYWDTEVYNRCLADMVCGQVWDARQWTRPAEALEPQEEITTRPNQAEEFAAR